MFINRINIAALLLFCSIIPFTAPGALAQNAAPTTMPSTQPVFPAVETVVFFRHGEKPATGLGQLTPQGLNRALALSVLLPQKFGKPDYLFAPDPAQQNSDGGHAYYYVRPLVTIEPTAIRLGMPVQTPCGYKETGKLDDELSKPEYAHAMIFVSWEHTYGQKAAAALFAKFGGDAAKVPIWPSADFDSLYVITIHRDTASAATATFERQQENLNGQSKEMPSPAGK